ncbi:hypothetical protein BDZ97DRAFT_1809021 [Flammula alnicola]|nr:hypothetical protein BDZ97DRAFT_1809021 [Flammula alnicola]
MRLLNFYIRRDLDRPSSVYHHQHTFWLLNFYHHHLTLRIQLIHSFSGAPSWSTSSKNLLLYAPAYQLHEGYLFRNSPSCQSSYAKLLSLDLPTLIVFLISPARSRTTYARQLERRVVRVWKFVTRATRKQPRNSFIASDFIVLTSRRRSTLHPQLYRFPQ